MGAHRRYLRGAGAVPALTLSIVTPARATDEIIGTATRVHGGDTLVVTTARGDTEIRLADIGAPQGSGSGIGGALSYGQRSSMPATSAGNGRLQAFRSAGPNHVRSAAHFNSVS
jgi:endonuclease YncB( thermonuclease family)